MQPELFSLHALLHSINVPGRAFFESDYASAMPLKLRPNSLSCARAWANSHETQASSKPRFVADMTPPWLYGIFRRDSIQNRQCLLASKAVDSLNHKPLDNRINIFIARLCFRGIYFPQLGPFAWMKTILANRRTILKLIKQGWKTTSPHSIGAAALTNLIR